MAITTSTFNYSNLVQQYCNIYINLFNVLNPGLVNGMVLNSKAAKLFQKYFTNKFHHLLQYEYATHLIRLCNLIVVPYSQNAVQSWDKGTIIIVQYTLMINLNEEVQWQKFKLFNIFMQHLKQTYMTVVMNRLVSTTDAESAFYLRLIMYVTLISIAFNFMCALFLLCFKKEFPKLEYFIVYVINLFIFLSLLVYSLRYFTELHQANERLSLFIKGYILLLMMKEIEILTIMIFPFETSNRLANHCTVSVFALLILSSNDKVTCNADYSFELLGIMLVNILGGAFNLLFGLVLFRYNRLHKEIRNFVNLISMLVTVVYVALYFAVIVAYHNINAYTCGSIEYILESYIYIAPIHLFIFTFVIFQEFRYIYHQYQNELIISRNPSLQSQYTSQVYAASTSNLQQPRPNHRQSLKSLSSVVNNPMDASLASASPNFGQDKVPLQKLGTSQFGASQHNGMNHSWANVQNNNPFNQSDSDFPNFPIVNLPQRPNKKVDSKSIDSMIRQEESQLNDNNSAINNPMDSGSVLTIK